MAEEPLRKKLKVDPEPPSRPPEGQEHGEGIAVVAERMAESDGLEGVKSAFRKRLQRIDFKGADTEIDLNAFLDKFKTNFIEELKDYLKQHRGVKVYLVLTISYLSQEIPEREAWIFYLGSEAQSIHTEGQIAESTKIIFNQILTKNDHLVRTKTGLVIEQIHWASIFLSKFAPLSGESFQELPKFLKLKRAIINVQNADNRCFGYSILAYLHLPKRNPHLAINYNKFFQLHGLDQITYPVEIEQIPEIEEKIKIAINVFSFLMTRGKQDFQNI